MDRDSGREGKESVRGYNVAHAPEQQDTKSVQNENGHHENRETEIETDKLLDLNSPSSSHKLNR